MKKPHPTPPPEAETGTVAPPNGELMDHDEHSAEPSGKPAESELHVDSLGGAPQVPLGSPALFGCLVCSSALHLYLIICRSWLAICAEIFMADSTAFFVTCQESACLINTGCTIIYVLCILRIS